MFERTKRLLRDALGYCEKLVRPETHDHRTILGHLERDHELGALNSFSILQISASVHLLTTLAEVHVSWSME